MNVTGYKEEKDKEYLKDIYKIKIICITSFAAGTIKDELRGFDIVYL